MSDKKDDSEASRSVNQTMKDSPYGTQIAGNVENLHIGTGRQILPTSANRVIQGLKSDPPSHVQVWALGMGGENHDLARQIVHILKQSDIISSVQARMGGLPDFNGVAVLFAPDAPEDTLQAIIAAMNESSIAGWLEPAPYLQSRAIRFFVGYQPRPKM